MIGHRLEGSAGASATVAILNAGRSTSWQPLVAFVHIPRTGGGSVTSAISNAYARAKSVGNVQRNADRCHSTLQRIADELDAWSGRALADHIPYGLYARYLPPDTRYVTFLRNPVERVLSHYHFHARKRPEKLRTIWGREDPAATVGEADDVSLEAGLARGISIYNNFATRFLWGAESLEDELSPDALERAKANLDRFSFVGVTERLDESLVLLGRVLGVPLAGYHLRHVTERPKADAFPDTLIRQIEQHNALDIELYRIARERFDAAADAAGDLAAEVEQLTQQRAEVTDQAEAKRVQRKAVRADLRQAEKRKRRRPGPVAEDAEAISETQTEDQSDRRSAKVAKRRDARRTRQASWREKTEEQATAGASDQGSTAEVDRRRAEPRAEREARRATRRARRASGEEPEKPRERSAGASRNRRKKGHEQQTAESDAARSESDGGEPTLPSADASA